MSRALRMTRRLLDLALAGARVELRPHRPDDAAEAFALLAGEDRILRWLLWEGPATPLELAQHYRDWNVELLGAPDLRLAIRERAAGRLVGSLSLRFGGHPEQGDVGYWIGVAHQGRGYGREALELAAHLAFRHLGAHALYAWVFVGNLASRRVLEHGGFTLARTVPGRVTKRGLRVDEWYFVLLASEWRRLRPDFRAERDEVRFGAEPSSDPLEIPARPFPSG